MPGERSDWRQPPRGTRDLFEQDLVKIESVSAMLFRLARTWGFTRVDTPTFEHAELFRSTATFSEEKCYVFRDKSERELVLRTDLNAPMVRAVICELGKKLGPHKLFFCDKVFRYRKSKKREFLMFGLETFGSFGEQADAEVLRIVGDAVLGFGFPGFTIEFGNVRIIPVLLEEAAGRAGITLDIPSITNVIRTAKHPEAMASVLSLKGLWPGTIELLCEVRFRPVAGDEAFAVLERVCRNYPTVCSELDRLMRFRDALREYGLTQNTLSLSNMHGTGFYSGLTYRLIPGGCPEELADGGRYDHMSEAIGGPAMPACGVGFGIERFIRFAERQDLTVPQERIHRILIYFMDSTSALDLRSGLSILRAGGVSVEEELNPRKRIKTVRYAQTRGHHLVFFVRTGTSGGFDIECVRLSPDQPSESVHANTLEEALACIGKH